MAATRLIALHANKGKTIAQSLSDRTDYAKNPEKTQKGELVTGYACDPMTVDEEFLLSRRQYMQSTGREKEHEVIAYQIRQSFKPGEITPEKANELGRELALRFTKGKYAFIVATHTDKAHIHNHIVFNSVSIDGSKKYKDHLRSGLALQKVSDLICLENQLSVIKPRTFKERKAQKQDPQKMGLVIDLQGRMQGKGAGYKRWATTFNLKQMSKTLLFLREHGIDSIQELNELAGRQSAKSSELLKTIKVSEQRLTEIGELKKNIVNYSKTREVYEQYRKAGYSKKFLEAHREEILLHKAAKEAFDKIEGGRIPKIKELSTEYESVLEQKRRAYAEYKQMKTETQELLIAQKNIASLYAAEEKTEKQKPEKTTKSH